MSLSNEDYEFIQLLDKALEIRQTKPKGTDMYECFEEALYGKREPYKIPRIDSKYCKLHLASVYGEMIRKDLTKEYKNMFEGKQVEYVDSDSCTYTWQELPHHLLTLTVQEFQEVMDDGLANGFEFKLQGSTILYREVQS